MSKKKTGRAELMKDICCSKFDFDYIATKHNMSKPKILDSVQRYVGKCDPELARKLKRNINVRILKEFVASSKSSAAFAQEYRISLPRFIRIVCETVQSTDIVPSDSVADSVFRKAIRGFKMSSTNFPERIVRIVCERYARNRFMLQKDLALPYDMENRAIANVLKRGIAEDIVSDEVADGIYQNILNSHFPCSDRNIAAYDKAFEARRVTKLKKKLHQMEAILYADTDEPVDTISLEKAIINLKEQIDRLESHLT